MELCHLTWFLVQNLILLSVFSKSLLVWTFKTKFAWKLSEVAITVSQAGRTAIDKGKRLRLTSLKSIKCPEFISHQLPYGVILNLPCRSLSNLLYILHKQCNLDDIGIVMCSNHPPSSLLFTTSKGIEGNIQNGRFRPTCIFIARPSQW